MSLLRFEAEVKQYLLSKHILADPEWIEGCVEFLTSNNSIKPSDYKTLAYEQWLLNDIFDVGVGCLPKNLNTLKKTTLPGKYVLQVNCCLDVGSPAYQQLQILNQQNVDDVEATKRPEDKISSHRMLKMLLTDGIENIGAIEYKPMRNLNPNITPGCKILIKGPVDCRRGLLLLQEKNVEILGGEVDKLVASNSLPKMLAELLNIDANHLPRSDNRDLPPAVTQPQNQPIANARPTIQAPIVGPQSTFIPPNPQNKPVAIVTSVQTIHNDSDDDIDLEALEELETRIYATQHEEVPRMGRKNSNKGSSRPESITVSNHFRDSSENVSNYIKELPKPSCSSNFKSQEKAKSKMSCQTLDRYLSTSNEHGGIKRLSDDNESNISKKTKIESDNIVLSVDDFTDLFDDEPEFVSPDPFSRIQELNNMAVYEKGGKVFYVKAKILKLLSKLSIGKSGWNLKCTLTDGSGEMDVDFTSQVLTELVGISVEEMNRIKKEMNSKPELKQRAIDALDNAKRKLQTLNCIIEISYDISPEITKLIEETSENLEKLKKPR